MSTSESSGALPPQTVLLTIVYDSGMDARVTETLEEIGVPGWTKVFGAHGFGGTGPKLDTPVWPGTVNLLYLALEEAQAEEVVRRLRALQATYRRKPGLTLWTQPVTLQ